MTQRESSHSMSVVEVNYYTEQSTHQDGLSLSEDESWVNKDFPCETYHHSFTHASAHPLMQPFILFFFSVYVEISIIVFFLTFLF